MPKPMLIAGNWKMNGLTAGLAELEPLRQAADAAPPGIAVAVAPPFTLIAGAAARAAGSRLSIGGQDCHSEPAGARTGSVSAPMLADLGCSFVIVGHSERRAGSGETDADVRAKAEAAQAAGLRPIICVGETEADRDRDEAEGVVRSQLAGSLPDDSDVVVAYEPVWAIGTGRTASAADVAAMHALIRAELARRYPGRGAAIPILYGGSVKASNAAEILAVPDVGGALVGGASLTAADFLPIIAAACEEGR